jgi:hypothetical protein
MKRLGSALALLFVLTALASQAYGSAVRPDSASLRVHNLADYPNLTFYVLHQSGKRLVLTEVRPGEAVDLVDNDSFLVVAVPRGHPAPQVGDLTGGVQIIDNVAVLEHSHPIDPGVQVSGWQFARVGSEGAQRVQVGDGPIALELTFAPVRNTANSSNLVALGAALSAVGLAAGLFVVWFLQRCCRPQVSETSNGQRAGAALAIGAA